MKAFWQQQGRRIDALSLRERGIMFVSLAVAMAAATDALVLSPRMAEQKALTVQLRKQSAELDTMRLRLSAQAPGNTDTPQGRLQAELASVRSQRQALDAQVRQLADAAGSGVRLPELLERVLRRHDKLTLLRLATAAPAPAPATAPARAPATAPDGDTLVPPQQGVDLELSGAYADLVKFMADTEAALPGLRWSELHLASLAQPPVLKVRVYLVATPGERP